MKVVALVEAVYVLVDGLRRFAAVVEQPPVSIESATISKTKQCPSGHHGRAQPYKPTPQEKGKWHATRGKVPNGVTEQDWIQAYNRADDKVRKSFGKKKAAGKKKLLRHEKLGIPETPPSTI